MITARLIYGGVGRRLVEVAFAALVVAVATAAAAVSVMVVDGARTQLDRSEQRDRPDLVHIKARFNRALFETPRSGALRPATLPVYEPRIDPATLDRAAGGAGAIPRQSLLRNVVAGDTFHNTYIFGIDPRLEAAISPLHLANGRALRPGDGDVAVVDQASARDLDVRVGDHLSVRTGAGTDLRLTIVGVADRLDLRYPPPDTIPAPQLCAGTGFVTSGLLVPLPASERIFARDTLTDAVVVASRPDAVPALLGRLRQAFRGDEGVFVEERYHEWRRNVADMRLTLRFFIGLALTVVTLAGAVSITLLIDIHRARRRYYATLAVLGISPARVAGYATALSTTAIGAGAVAGALAAIAVRPRSLHLPSLLSHLGTVRPRPTPLMVGPAVVILLAAVAVTVATVLWPLLRDPARFAAEADA